MKALLISPSSAPGGAERAFASLARRIPEHGVHCEAVLLQPGPLEQWLSEAGCKTEVLETGRTRHVHRTAGTIAALARRAKNVDVVLSNQSKGHVYGGLAARIAGRPAVWWQQGTPGRSRIELAAAAIPSAAVIVSSHMALQAQRRITPRRRVELIHLGIDVSTVRAARRSGSSIRAKNGWGDGIDDRVSFVGHQDDVYPWFDALDVVVHASHGELSASYSWRLWHSASHWSPPPPEDRPKSRRTGFLGSWCHPAMTGRSLRPSPSCWTIETYETASAVRLRRARRSSTKGAWPSALQASSLTSTLVARGEVVMMSTPTLREPRPTAASAIRTAELHHFMSWPVTSLTKRWQRCLIRPVTASWSMRALEQGLSLGGWQRKASRLPPPEFGRISSEQPLLSSSAISTTDCPSATGPSTASSPSSSLNIWRPHSSSFGT